MPIYGYRCTSCSHTFEREQRITADPIRECEICGSLVKKIIYPVGIAFKGSGFYVNDYKAGPGKTPAPVATDAAPVVTSDSTPADTPAPTVATPSVATKTDPS